MTRPRTSTRSIEETQAELHAAIERTREMVADTARRIFELGGAHDQSKDEPAEPVVEGPQLPCS